MTKTKPEAKPPGPKRGRGRPRIAPHAEIKHFYLADRHIRALEMFKVARGFTNLSAAMRGLLEMVMAAGMDKPPARGCVSCGWGTEDPTIRWCPKCEGKVRDAA